MSNVWLDRVLHATPEEERRFGMVDEFIRSLIQLRQQAAEDHLTATVLRARLVRFLAQSGGHLPRSPRDSGEEIMDINTAFLNGEIRLVDGPDFYQLTDRNGLTIRTEEQLEDAISKKKKD